MSSASTKSGEKATRSRRGCLTCRKRHKKCDETFGPTGACQRCFNGSWECIVPPPPGQKPLRTFEPGRRADPPVDQRLTSAPRKVHKGQQQSVCALVSQRPPADLPVGPESISPPIPTSFPLPSLPLLPSPPLTLPNASFGPLADSNYSPLGDTSLLVSAGELSAEPEVDLDDFFASLDAIAGPNAHVEYWENDMVHSEGHEGLPNLQRLVEGQASPLDDMGVSSAPSLHTLPPSPPPHSGSTSLTRPDVDSCPPSLPQPRRPPSPSPGSAIAPPRDARLVSPQPPLDDEGFDPMSAPHYIAWNESYWKSMPKPVREIVAQRMNHVASTSELTRCASMAMVLIYRARKNSENPDDMKEAQARLLEKSEEYFKQALVHLQTPIPLEAQIVAVLDMQAYQWDQYGAAAAHAILLLGEYFVTEAFGPHPPLNLANLRDSSSMALRAFAYTDVLHTICIPRRRTLFAFASLPGDPATPSDVSTPNTGDEADRAVEIHLGLPVGLLLCLAAISNLSAEMGSFPEEVVALKAQAIEKTIRDWRPLAPDAAALADSAAYIDELSTAEMWRHTALLYLYQAVHQHGCLSVVVRACLQQILQIGARVMNAPSPLHSADQFIAACATRSVPWFLAGTVAIMPNDREMCRKGLTGCGPQKGYKDNLEAIERVWEIVDTQGWAINWRDMLQSEHRFVGFL